MGHDDELARRLFASMKVPPKRKGNSELLGSFPLLARPQ